uniref:Reverse transcriptase domain-containing protein n=1 Tax=Anolis carolinensis TaxID=28377 RepID=A0A803TC32_ANOCA
MPIYNRKLVNQITSFGPGEEKERGQLDRGGGCSDGWGASIEVVSGRGRYGKGRPNHSIRPRVFGRTLIVPKRSPDVANLGSQDGGPSRLKVVLFNARSVNGKTSFIQDLILDEHVDLACITETWLDEMGGVNLTQLCPPGYSVQHQPRSGGRGGGVAVVYRDSIPLTRCPVPQSTMFECVHLRVGDRDRLGILLVYRPPRCTTVSLPELAEVVSGLAVESRRLIVLGDFNVHAEANLSGAAQDFMAAMATMGLSQLISGPTHSVGHTLDLVFCQGWEEGGGVEELTIAPLPWTDHHLIRFRLTAPPNLCRGGGPKMVRPRRLMDPEGFLTALGEFPASSAGDPVDALVSLWNGEMTTAIDTIAPECPLSSKRAKPAPWFTEELAAMKRKKRELECVWRSEYNESDRTRLGSYLRAYAAAIKAARRVHLADNIASAQNRLAALFRVIRGLLTPTNQGGSPDNSAARCEAFARFFADKVTLICSDFDTILTAVSEDVTSAPACPVLLDSFQLVELEDVDKILGEARPTTCILDPCPSWLVREARGGLAEWVKVVVNASLREGKFPASLKMAVIKPLLKKPSLDPTQFGNFRPISNLPYLGKVLEHVVASQLQGFLVDTDFLDPAQSALRPGHGTETALVALVDDLRRELDRGSVSLLVLLDLSAAFDTVDHGILLGRLAGMGLGGTVLQWLHSFLEGRSQMVSLGDACSAPQPLTCGVPQGSVLSPMLFNIYMKPLGEIIRSFGVRCHLYADDVQLCHSFPPVTKEAVQVLNRCLAAVSDWMRANKLKLNPDKTEVLLVSRKAEQGIGLQPVLDGVTLPLKAQVRSLGVILDSSLSLEPQVSAVARGVFAQLKLVRQLRPYLGKQDFATVVHALVTSRLDYCNALYVGLPLKTVWKLQLVQWEAARLITGAAFRERTTPLLRQLHWLPISYRAQFKVLALAYKALNGSGPAYLSERVSRYDPPRSLRSSDEALLAVPSASQVRLAGTRDRAFSVVAPCLWNALPIEVRQAPSLLSFRRKVKTWLWGQAFE